MPESEEVEVHVSPRTEVQLFTYYCVALVTIIMPLAVVLGSMAGSVWLFAGLGSVGIIFTSMWLTAVHKKVGFP